jgi:hypothetical protein
MWWWLLGAGVVGGVAVLASRSAPATRPVPVFTVIVSPGSGMPSDAIAAAVARGVQRQRPGAVFLGTFPSGETPGVMHFLYRGGRDIGSGWTSSEIVRIAPLLNRLVADVEGNITTHRELGAFRGLPRMMTSTRRRH